MSDDEEVEYTNWWSTDASCSPAWNEAQLAKELRKNPQYVDDPHGYMALIPCTRDGKVDGPGRLLSIEMTTRSPSQLELLAVLCAHVIARADGERQPLVYTDCQDVDSLLDLLLGRRRQRKASRRRKFEPLPDLISLIEVLGDEVDYVHSCWQPRCYTPALRIADNLANLVRRPRLQSIGPDDWAETSFEEILDMARTIRAAAQTS